MKGKTVRNLVIGAVTLLGISYVVEKCINDKKRNLTIEKSKKQTELEELEELKNKERKYYPIGDVVSENGKYIVKKVI